MVFVLPLFLLQHWSSWISPLTSMESCADPLLSLGGRFFEGTRPLFWRNKTPMIASIYFFAVRHLKLEQLYSAGHDCLSLDCQGEIASSQSPGKFSSYKILLDSAGMSTLFVCDFSSVDLLQMVGPRRRLLNDG